MDSGIDPKQDKNLGFSIMEHLNLLDYATSYSEPSPHILLENVFTSNQLDNIWREIKSDTTFNFVE